VSYENVTVPAPVRLRLDQVGVGLAARDDEIPLPHEFLTLLFLARRNSTESLFSALQVGHHLGTDGADRTRTPKQATAHTLIDLALLLRNAYMLASLRIEHGEFPETPPPALARALGIEVRAA